MKKIIRFRVLLFSCIFCTSLYVHGQDLHYSQFHNSPININPASTGIFNGDVRYMASFRDQWRSVPVPWLTFSGSYDRKYFRDNDEKGFFGFGFLFNYDRQGDSKLNLTNLNLSGSYTRILNKSNLITGGLLLGFSSRGFNISDLTWDKQWDGDRFDSSLSPGENFDLMRVNFLETGAGINYRWQKTTRTKIDFGIGLFHFIQPKPNFFNSQDLALPIRLSYKVDGNFQLTEKLDIQLNALHQMQREYRETLVSGLFKFLLNNKRGQETEIHLGLGYRTTQAIWPQVALKYKNIYVGLSYDIDISDFSNVTDNRGGPEIHFRYIITRVKPLGKFKVCPIY